MEEQNIEKDHKNLGSKCSDTRSGAKDSLSRHTPQTELFRSESLSSLRKVRFSDQKFAIGIPVSNIKFNHLGLQNNNPFYPFHDQLNYRLAKYFAEFKITKSNINKFLFEP